MRHLQVVQRKAKEALQLSRFQYYIMDSLRERVLMFELLETESISKSKQVRII